MGASGLLPLAACGSSSDNSTAGSTSPAAACDSPGISATEIKPGNLYPLSGPTVSQRNGWGQGVRARIALQNDAGGVNGRKLVVFDRDDQGTATVDFDGAKDPVEAKGVFAIFQAAILNGASDYLNGLNVPVVGHPASPPYDGTRKNFIGIWGIFSSTQTTSAPADFIRSKGGSTVAIIAHNNPMSLPAAQLFKFLATQNGWKIGYTRLDLPFVPGDFTADAQQMKANGVDSLFSPVANAVSTFARGGAYTQSPTAPFEAQLPETKKYQAAMAKYAADAPINIFSMEGWNAGELMIEGLQKSGSCPTRQGFIDTVRGMKDWNGHGTLPLVDFSKPQVCNWYINITADGYAVDNKNPTCGKLVSLT